jgi:hypothetical protein
MPYLTANNLQRSDETPRWSRRTTQPLRIASDLVHTLAGDHAELVSLVGLIRALVPETDHRSVDQRRRLVRQLRIRLLAHARGVQVVLPGERKLTREHNDLTARLDQLQVIPLDHPLWIAHFDEMERRLRACSTTCERELNALLRGLEPEARDELARRYAARRKETLDMFERQPGRRAARRMAAQAAS